MNAILEPTNKIDDVDVIGGLTASSVLVDLNISTWVGRKTDSKSTNKVIQDNNAKAAKAANVVKNLFVGNPKLEEIQRRVNRARAYVAEMTLPWMGDLKLLPMSSFVRFQDGMNQLRDDFELAVIAFLADYDNEVSAMQVKLGNLFDRAEYPTAAQLRRRFRFTWNIMPLPTAGDFRVEAEAQLKSNLREAYQDAMEDRINNCMQLMWGRLKTCLEHMLDRLDIGEDGKPNVFRDTMLENAQELVVLLKDMNLTQDPKMEAVRKQLAAAINGVEPKELRTNTGIREDVRQNVQNILDKFAF